MANLSRRNFIKVGGSVAAAGATAVVPGQVLARSSEQSKRIL